MHFVIVSNIIIPLTVSIIIHIIYMLDWNKYQLSPSPLQYTVYHNNSLHVFCPVFNTLWQTFLAARCYITQTVTLSVKQFVLAIVNFSKTN